MDGGLGRSEFIEFWYGGCQVFHQRPTNGEIYFVRRYRAEVRDFLLGEPLCAAICRVTWVRKVDLTVATVGLYWRCRSLSE
jgi:hypothetical protein